ncbi:unnamed protein product [Paramecium primaurelia]|uniref:Uncharacterized protein n=1 Tax=Paramecium primaurelia TaxID=5886 RepID=A0A8S1KK78_PARPR|nr:unnamed protein product [Paramecium primaurelia]
MKPIKIKNNENVIPLPQRSKILYNFEIQDLQNKINNKKNQLQIVIESFENPAQFNISLLRLKVENDAQEYLEAISAFQTIEIQNPIVKERAKSWKILIFVHGKSKETYNQIIINIDILIKNNKRVFKFRQQSPKIQQQNKITNKIIQYPLTGYLERNQNQLLQRDKYLKIIQNLTGETHRKNTKKILPISTQTSRAQSSLSFQL